MKCLVPLAGPDLWTPHFGLRPLFPVDRDPLLRHALRGRAWAKALASKDYVFVVRDIPQSVELYEFLEIEWPGCQVVKIPALVKGAMLSALCGLAYAHDGDPLVVDLADILFERDIDIKEFDRGTGMIVPVFSSDSPDYSYLKIVDGVVIEAAEKVVISNHASAGVYAFAGADLFLAAAVHSLQNSDTVTFNGNFFICPMVNGVIALGRRVLAPHVGDVRPVGKLFHQPERGVR
jgi:hypothetical protein